MGNLGEWQQEREANTKCQQSKVVSCRSDGQSISCVVERKCEFAVPGMWLFWKFILIYTAFCCRFVDEEDNNDNKKTYKTSDAQLNCSPPTKWCPASSWAVAPTNLPKLPQQSLLLYSKNLIWYNPILPPLLKRPRRALSTQERISAAHNTFFFWQMRKEELKNWNVAWTVCYLLSEL